MILAFIGDGKGKTSAAIGAAIRAAGSGRRVAFVQFDKGPVDDDEFYSERKILRRIDNIDLILTGLGRVLPNDAFRFANTEDDKKEALRGFDAAIECVCLREYFLVVLDEILESVHNGLLERHHLDSIIKAYRSQKQTHLILTGRHAPDDIAEIADLVTEMKSVKHYYDDDIKAIKGLDY